MLRNISLSFALILGLTVQAQNHVDALRYSQESLWGSARFVGMGGAFGSLGANANSASHNPAGIAIYTTSEFSGSFSINDVETESTLLDSKAFAKNSATSLPNINYVSANLFNPEDIGDWNRINFGVGYNKLDDYNRNILIESEMNTSSYSDVILNNSQSTYYEDLNPFRELLAFNTYLIDTIGSSSNYFSPASGLYNKDLSYSSNQSGSKNEFYISVGTAYQNKLFIGATIGFPSIEYKEVTTISESNFSSLSQEIIQLSSFDYSTNLYVSGSGINLKLGLLYKLDKNIRYGLALHTPTYYEIHEEYSANMTTEFLDGQQFYSGSPSGVFDYGMNTPFKLINSLSFILNKKAIISIDYEYLNFASTSIVSDFYNFSTENNNIENYYTSTANIKIGTELRVHPQLSLRAGFTSYGSPYAGSINDASREYITMGMGLRVNQYFFDLAIVNSVNSEEYYIYEGANGTTLQNNNGQLLISSGLKF